MRGTGWEHRRTCAQFGLRLARDSTDRIALMGACDNGRAAEMAPQTVMLVDLPTYDAYCGRRTSSDWGALTMTGVVQERRRRGPNPRIDGLAPSDPCPSDVRVGKPVRIDLP